MEESPDFYLVHDFADGWIYFPDEDGALLEAEKTGALAVACYRVKTPVLKTDLDN